jgi:hypothetical protein
VLKINLKIKKELKIIIQKAISLHQQRQIELSYIIKWIINPIFKNIDSQISQNNQREMTQKVLKN